MKLLLFLFGAALAAGLYFVLADMLKIPRLARISVIRRPSIKLKITPHMQPNDRPFRNIAAML